MAFGRLFVFHIGSKHYRFAYNEYYQTFLQNLHIFSLKQISKFKNDAENRPILREYIKNIQSRVKIHDLKKKRLVVFNSIPASG